MVRVFYIFFLVISPILCFGQIQSRIDSLIELMSHSEGEEKIKYINLLGWEYVHQDREIAIDYFSTALEISLDKKYKTWIPKLQQDIGRVYYEKRLFNRARYYLEKALQGYETSRNIDRIPLTKIEIGECYRQEYAYDIALDQYFKALHLLEVLNIDLRMQIYALHKIGDIYKLTGNFPQSFDYYLKAQDLARNSGVLKDRVDVKMWLGRLELEKNDGDKAIEYFSNALKMIPKGKNTQVRLAEIYRGLGQAANLNGEYEHAEENLLKSKLLNEKVGSYMKIARSNKYLAEFYISNDQTDTAIFYYLNALEMVEKHKNAIEKAQLLIDIANAYLKKKSYNDAFYFAEKGYNLFQMQENLNGIMESAYTLSRIFSLLNYKDKQREYAEIYSQTKLMNNVKSTQMALRIAQYDNDYLYSKDWRKKIDQYSKLMK